LKHRSTLSAVFWTAFFLIILLPSSSACAVDAPVLDHDPHRNKIGFFDIHICNWPDRPHFFKLLFSTEKFKDVDTMEIFYPSGGSLAVLKKSHFKEIKRKNKPEKRVFMMDMDMPDNATSGWYMIRVKTYDGKEHVAKDYVPMTRLNRVEEMVPSADEGTFSLPVTLAWNKVSGAGFYKVYIRDEWTGEMIYKTKLISENSVKIPDGKLSPGGYYSWSVHARDTNEHILLGDFHLGSMSKKAFFTVAE